MLAKTPWTDAVGASARKRITVAARLITVCRRIVLMCSPLKNTRIIIAK